MASKKSKSRNGKQIKSRIDLFGPPAILVGESEATYNEIFKGVYDALKPTDIFEEFAARDIANGMMDSLRFARLKSELLNSNMHIGMERVLTPKCNLSVQLKFDMPMVEAEKIAAAWAMGEPKSTKIVDVYLDSGAISMAAVAAETLSYKMDAFEGIDRLALNFEVRRHANMREIERRREAKTEVFPPVARSNRLAALDQPKANDNDTPVQNGEIIEIEAEQVEMDGASEMSARSPNAVGE